MREIKIKIKQNRITREKVAGQGVVRSLLEEVTSDLWMEGGPALHRPGEHLSEGAQEGTCLLCIRKGNRANVAAAVGGGEEMKSAR